MRKLYTSLILFFILPYFALSQSFEYVSPKDNSKLVSLSTNIILKSSEYVDQNSLSPDKFTVIGSVSGNHSGTVKLSDDNKTILFLPDNPFAPNENVKVVVNSGIETITGNDLPSVLINFQTTPLANKININPFSLIGDGVLINSPTQNRISGSLQKETYSSALPSDFPGITIDSTNNPSSGKIFLTNFSINQGDTTGNYLIILNNDGSVYKYKKLTQPSFDFKVLPDGRLSYADVVNNYGGYGDTRWIVMDTAFTPLDTIECGNGYSADIHDFLLLPNGHSIVFAYDPEPMDMSQFGGDTNATVIGTVIQELDVSKNVVFQWRSWDYIPITDSYIDLTTNTVDLIHANAISVDLDGNIVLSMRHLSSIIKIDRQTGNIKWFLGGKENQFTFLNENSSNAPDYFSYQHDVRIWPDGNMTLFDNGNQHSPNYSRAVEYKLDEQNKTADMVWEYRHNPDIYSFAMGSVQRLSNGNTLICWGYAGFTGSPIFTEIHPDNSVALEASMSAGQGSYRVYKFPWSSGLPEAIVNMEVLPSNTYEFNTANDTTGVTITFNQLNSGLYANATVTKYNYAPVNPGFTSTAPIMVANYFNLSQLGIASYSGDFQVNIGNYPAITNPQSTIVYVRSSADSSFVPVATSYDSAKNELTFTASDFGDFAFGIPQVVDSAYVPFPFFPKNSDTVATQSVELRWGTRGIVSSFHLQVATDPAFNNLVIDTAGFNSTVITDSTLSEGSFYYWRVNNTNSAGTSAWSDTVSFYLSPTTGLNLSNNTVVNEFNLAQNYPNPFNPSTTINYEIPKTSLVKIKIYDILGRQVAELVNEEKPTGRYNVTFDASGFSSGIYFYSIDAGSFHQTKKMVLLK